MKNETNEHIRAIFFKWADERGVDKSLYERWNEFLSIWNVCLDYLEGGMMLKLPLKTKAFNRRHGTPWSSCLPFVDNSRALLLHRPKCVAVFKNDGRPSHLAVENWCGNTSCGTDKYTFTETCEGEKLLCARCEANATSQGLPSADELSGHHVHQGKVIAVRTCCIDQKDKP